MMPFVDGIVVIFCTFACGFFIATGKPIGAVLAFVVGVLAWNHLAGLYK